MKCEICGKEPETGNRWLDDWIDGGVFGNFCLSCGTRVKEHVEWLKPKVVVHAEPEGYILRDNHAEPVSILVPNDFADALYEYMRLARGE